MTQREAIIQTLETFGTKLHLIVKHSA